MQVAIGADARAGHVKLGVEMGHIGQSVLRVEDERLLRGQGRYLSDLRIPGTLEAVFVRSTQAHATISRLDVETARRARNVVAVFTAADLAGRGSRSASRAKSTRPSACSASSTRWTGCIEYPSCPSPA